MNLLEDKVEVIKFNDELFDVFITAQLLDEPNKKVLMITKKVINKENGESKTKTISRDVFKKSKNCDGS